MQRLFLVADQEARMSFDGARLRRIIQGLKGVTGWREGVDSVDPEGTLFECELETGDPRNIRVPIEVTTDLRSASVGAFHEDGLKAALEIQRHYGSEIFAFSEEAQPLMVPLSKVNSPDELAALLKLRE